MARGKSHFGRVFRRKRNGKYAPGFYVRARIRGTEVTRWAGPDRKTAHEFLADLLRKSAREDLLGEKAIAAVSFEGMKSVLLAHFDARHEGTTIRSERSRVEAIVAYFGARPIHDATAGDVQDFLTFLKTERKLSTATVNRYASCLSVAFRLAVEKGYARTNPAKGIGRPKEDRRAVPFLSADDVRRIVAGAGEPRWAAFLRVVADTGLRRSEAVALEWRDVDLARAVLLVRHSKTHEPREVPLTRAARAAFEALHAERGAVPMRGSDPVWPELRELHIASLSARFSRLADAAGFEGLRLHDLRHGFCSRLAQAGVPVPTIGALAGHKCLTTTMRYSDHLPDGATVEAIRRLEAPPRTPNEAPKGDTKGDTANRAGASDAAAAG